MEQENIFGVSYQSTTNENTAGWEDRVGYGEF
jgi:hypothetical protein